MPKRTIKAASVALLVVAGGSGVAEAEIKIAVAGPMTGEYAVFGAQMVLGATQAVTAINAAGGVNGEPLVLDTVDDGCDPGMAETAAKRVAATGTVFVAGHFCSGSSVAASPFYASSDIVMISPATGTPRFTDERPGQGIFRLYQRDDRQGEVLGPFMAQTFKDKAIAIVDDGSAYGVGFADATASAMRAAGKTEAMRENYKPDLASYSDLIAKLIAGDAEVVFIAGYYSEVAQIRREMVAAGLDAILVSGDAIVTDAFWKDAGEAASGTLMTFVPDPRKNPAAESVLPELEKAGGSGEGFVLYTYAAIQAWAEAAASAGTTEFGPVVSALSAGTFPTVLGDISFDANGDARLPGYVIYEWKDGTYEEYDPG